MDSSEDPRLIPRYASTEAAEILKHPASTVRSLVAKYQIGTLKNLRLRLLADADIEALRNLIREAPGRPPNDNPPT